MLDGLKKAARAVTDAGKAKTDELKDQRRRKALVAELGGHCLSQAKLVGTDDKEIQRIVALIDEIDSRLDGDD